MPLHRLLLYAAEVTDGRAVSKAGIRPLGSFLPPKIQESKSLVGLVTFDPRQSILGTSPPEGRAPGLRRPSRRRGTGSNEARAECPLRGVCAAIPAQGAAARPTIGV